MLLRMDESLPAVLRVMDESPFEFHLTGSRFFGDPKPNDWDFYVQDDERYWMPGDLSQMDFDGSMPLRQFLDERCGFVLEHTSDYNDPNSAEVWRVDATDTHPQVHVQISSDVQARSIVTMLMKEKLCDIYLTSSKIVRRQLWRAMFALYKRASVEALPE